MPDAFLGQLVYVDLVTPAAVGADASAVAEVISEQAYKGTLEAITLFTVTGTDVPATTDVTVTWLGEDNVPAQIVLALPNVVEATYQKQYAPTQPALDGVGAARTDQHKPFVGWGKFKLEIVQADTDDVVGVRIWYRP